MPVLKSLVHMYEMCQMNRLWLTQIYLYRWYIPDLIRLANDTETNPGPVVVDNIDSSKTICAPYSQPSAVFNYEQNVRKSTRNHNANKNLLLIQQKLMLHRTVKVMLRFLVQMQAMQAHNVWQCLCQHLSLTSGIQ